MRVTRITTNIIHVDWDTQTEMTAALMRTGGDIAEPPWGDQPYTIGAFRIAWCEQYGTWSYPWSFKGLCLYVETIQDHIDGLYDPLTPEEAELVGAFRYTTQRPLVIVATFDGGTNTLNGTPDRVLDHELCHAFYCLDGKYRAAVKRTLKTTELDNIRNYLLNKGYTEPTLEDEVHAHIIGSSEYLESRGMKIPPAIKQKLDSLRDEAMRRAKEDD